MANPIQIDPEFCGCTECITGEYVPLSSATDEQVFRMVGGELGNATSERFTMTTVTENFPHNHETTFTLTAEYCGSTWSIVRDIP